MECTQINAHYRLEVPPAILMQIGVSAGSFVVITYAGTEIILESLNNSDIERRSSQDCGLVRVEENGLIGLSSFYLTQMHICPGTTCRLFVQEHCLTAVIYRDTEKHPANRQDAPRGNNRV